MGDEGRRVLAALAVWSLATALLCVLALWCAG